MEKQKPREKNLGDATTPPSNDSLTQPPLDKNAKTSESAGSPPEKQIPLEPEVFDPAATLAYETPISQNALSALLRENPDKAPVVVDALERLMLASDPKLVAFLAEAKNKKMGMIVGASLTTLTVTGGIATLCAGAPIVGSILLLSLGAACAGATFAVITGVRVPMSDFSKVFLAGKTFANPQTKKTGK